MINPAPPVPPPASSVPPPASSSVAPPAPSVAPPAPSVAPPAPFVPPPALPVPPKDFDLFKVWKEYEAMAMHFNDLLMRLRSQSLAAVATFATASGVLLKGDSIGKTFPWWTLAAVFFSLAVFWTAIWILDFLYYNRLLLGAVAALEIIEEASQKGKTRINQINLSTRIEAAVRKRKKGNLARGKGIVLFYLLVLLLLISGTLVSMKMSGDTIDDVRRVMRGSPSEQRSNNP